MEEKELTGAESLRLINEMIGKAKADYRETGVSALMWGSVIVFCSIVTLLNQSLQWPLLREVWILTLIAVLPQIWIARQERKQIRYRKHTDTALSNVWIAFGISLGLLSFYSNVHHPASPSSLFMIIYGIPTFVVGRTANLRSMIIGGIICWVCAIISFYTPFVWDISLTGFSALCAWLIPGILLRRDYLNAKRQHV